MKLNELLKRKKGAVWQKIVERKGKYVQCLEGENHNFTNIWENLV